MYRWIHITFSYGSRHCAAAVNNSEDAPVPSSHLFVSDVKILHSTSFDSPVDLLFRCGCAAVVAAQRWAVGPGADLGTPHELLARAVSLQARCCTGFLRFAPSHGVVATVSAPKTRCGCAFSYSAESILCASGIDRGLH